MIEMYERNLPPYLAHDLEAWKKGVEEKSRFLDCLWGELYGSIPNSDSTRPTSPHAARHCSNGLVSGMGKVYNTQQKKASHVYIQREQRRR